MVIMLIAFMIIAVLGIVVLISKRIEMSITRHHRAFILNKTQIRLYQTNRLISWRIQLILFYRRFDFVSLVFNFHDGVNINFKLK